MNIKKMILVIILTLIISIKIIKRKYSNPYKCIMLFGKKGSGKTCYMVNYMLKYLKKGWNVYTDCDVNIPGVRRIDPLHLSQYKPEENSVICIDEAGLVFNNRNFKAFNDGLTEFVKLQRHMRTIVILGSQSFDVDKKWRDCTDSLILQSNILNIISLSRPIARKVSLTDPTYTGKSEIVDAYKFTSLLTWKLYFMPKYFKYFNSFSAPERPLLPYTEVEYDMNNNKARNRRTFLKSCDKRLRNVIKKLKL